MTPHFTVAIHVAKPRHEVFEAVVDPVKLSGYFTTGGAQGRLETGATVTWDFHDFPGAFPVYVIEVVPDEKIVLQWQAADGDPPNINGGEPSTEAEYRTTVTMTFGDLDEGRRTKVQIKEEGWRSTDGGWKASYGNCQGWSQMLCALKCRLEYDINLREGAYN